MSSEWKEHRFGDAIDFQEGPGILAKDFREYGVPLVRLAGLSAPSVLEGCNFLDPDKVEKKWSHFRLLRGDVLLSTSASLGRIASVGPEAEGSVAYTGLIRMRPKTPDVLPHFIPYLLESPHFQRQIEAMGAGSVMQHFGPSHLKLMKVVLPPVTEQRRIAEVLGSLDAKIGTNRDQAARLDSIAQALFDQAIRTADESWTRVAVAEVANVNAKSHSAKSPPKEVNYLDIASSSTKRIDRLELLAWEEAPSRARRIVRDGDTLISTVRPERRAFVHVPTMPVPITASTGFAVISPDSIDPSFLYRSVTSNRAIGHFSASASGSAYPAVNAKVIAAFEFPMPSDAGTSYGAIAALIERQRWDLLRQNERLTAIRDGLLPRLVSGRLRVAEDYLSDADEPVGAAR